MRFPQFLVIGAMKSGTTTLYHDLLANPRIYLPDKEASFLRRDLSPAQYARAYRSSTPQQVRGDVSADYAMLPDSKDVGPRAKRLLGASAKIIYLVREPVSRTLSHHHHLSVRRGRERLSFDVDRCVKEHSCLIDYSRYALQLRPWIDAFGLDAVQVVRFEDFITQRRATVDEIYQFLGVPAPADDRSCREVHNRTSGKPVVRGVWKLALSSSVYRQLVRPLLKDGLRDKLKNQLLPKATGLPRPPAPDTVRYIVDRVADDVEELRRMLGHSEPMWDLQSVVARFQQQAPAVASTLAGEPAAVVRNAA